MTEVRTGDDLHHARIQLGWSFRTMARALRMCPMVAETAEAEQQITQAAKRIREIESGARPITGPVTVAVEGFLTGFRPAGFSDRE